jgi:hypothetical protein
MSLSAITPPLLINVVGMVDVDALIVGEVYVGKPTGPSIN